jgi:chromosome partitioning protein
MQTIALAGRKRGAGKTTLAVELATCAEHALILDLDPARKATEWAERREAPEPMVQPIGLEVLDAALEWARDQRFRWVFLDTSAQAHPEIVRAAIAAADVTLIPTRSGSAHLGALGEIVRMVQPTGRASAIVLNACIPLGGGIRGQLLKQAFAEARRYGLPVAPSVVAERSVFPEAFETGRAAVETDPDGKAATEILALWHWLAQEAHVLAA